MGVISFFKALTNPVKATRWKELGTYNARFNPFGPDIYQSEEVRAAVRALASYTSKAHAKSNNKKIEQWLNVRPNMYMDGSSFLEKIRIWVEIKNTAFIYIMRDDKGHAVGAYPVPYADFEALEYQNGLFIKFTFAGEAARELVLPWEDLAVIRKDYNKSDIAGDSNGAILDKLQVLSTVDQGVANAIKATANLRGILKSSKGMLSPEDIKKQKDTFVRDYMNLENEGGIASLDATQEFTPITMSPTVANAAMRKEFREDVYRYYGVSEAIITNDCTEEQREAFYDGCIEPFLVRLSTELEFKIFTERERGHGNYIVYEANRMQFASTKTKIQIFKEVVLYKGMTINEWREGCNMAPVPWGDKPIGRLDATQEVAPVQQEEEEEEEDES